MIAITNSQIECLNVRDCKMLADAISYYDDREYGLPVRCWKYSSITLARPRFQNDIRYIVLLPKKN